jgi:hypothetical protein
MKNARLAAGLICGILALGTALPGHAQLYAGAQMGYANADFTLGGRYNGVVDDGAFVYGLGVGYGLSEYISIEGNWYGYGNFSGRAAPCPVDGPCPPPTEQVPTSGNSMNVLALSMTPRLAFGDIGEVYGNLGVYRMAIDTSIGDAFKRRGLLIGAGARWEFAEPWSVHVEAKRFGDRMYQFAIGFAWHAQPLRHRQQG